MNKLLCPLMGILYYLIYFAITFVVFTFLFPDTVLTSIVAGLFIFLINPVMASISSSKTTCRIR